MALAFPQTYMNVSGEAVAPLVRRYGIDDPQQLVVVHDELDLPVGRMRVKVGGGLAGHNGLQVDQAAPAHRRLRAGPHRCRQAAGAAAGRRPRAASRPGKEERTEFDVVVQEAADAVEMIVGEGAAVAMNRYNADGLARARPAAREASQHEAVAVTPVKVVGRHGETEVGKPAAAVSRARVTPSMRAKGAPRQKWMPCPNARWRLSASRRRTVRRR